MILLYCYDNDNVLIFYKFFSISKLVKNLVTERTDMIEKRAWTVFINKDHDLYEWCADMTGKANNLSKDLSATGLFCTQQRCYRHF